MHLIDGKALAARTRSELKEEIAKLGIAPVLAVLLVGEAPASVLYVNLKMKAAEEVGIKVDLRHVPAGTTDAELTGQIEKWNEDGKVHAILVQVPLSGTHDENRILSAIDPKKDADGFHPENIKALMSGNPTIVPPVHEGILRLINEAPIKLAGAQSVIIANSDVFASPLKRLLTTAGASVAVFTADDVDRDILMEADLIVIAVGRLGFLIADMTRNDAVIIDVGTNKTAEGKTRGDTDLQSYEKTDVWITPVPGGVGPMTIAQLLKNVARLAYDSIPSGKAA